MYMNTKIIVVGGGTAGLVSALILKTKFPNKDISIIKSDKIGIIGVGEGSTEHWSHFMQYVGIDYRELIQHSDATFKYGVMFEGWKEHNFMHSIPDDLNTLRVGQYLSGYGKLIGDNADHKLFNPIGSWDGQIDTSKPIYQFHFNTHKLNNFLQEVCFKKNIEVITDDINDVIIEDYKITKLQGKQTTYYADFFIDCTGFKRLLISKLGSTWLSYAKWLKVNEAIAFQTPDTEEYNPYTLAKAMEYGWMWRIPVWGRWGNGYVFDNSLINADQAKNEVEKTLGIEIEIAKNIKFDPGRLENSWIENCCAIGLSSNFVEPLEATSIGSAIQQSFLLMHYIENYNNSRIMQYNNKVNSVLDNIRDFIILHYLNNSDKNDFWKKVNSIKLPKTLETRLKLWENNLPIKEDINDSDYVMFFEQNWTNVLYGLEYFNTDSIKKEYLSTSRDWQEKTNDAITQRTINSNLVSHKKYLESIRND